MRDKREDQPQSKDPYKLFSVSGLAGYFLDELGVPPSPRISGIMHLAENREVIYGAQQLTGKILSRKGLAPIDEFTRIPLSPWLVWARCVVDHKDWDHTGV